MVDILNIHHIGIITKNIIKSIDLYVKMGYRNVTGIIVDNIQKNNICFLQLGDSLPYIELIEPFDDNSTVSNAKKGIHHICYSVSDIIKVEEYLKKKKIGKFFKKGIIAPAINNSKVSFACLTDGSIIEFLQLNRGDNEWI